jgi:hypothetical protein
VSTWQGNADLAEKSPPLSILMTSRVSKEAHGRQHSGTEIPTRTGYEATVTEREAAAKRALS